MAISGMYWCGFMARDKEKANPINELDEETAGSAGPRESEQRLDLDDHKQALAAKTEECQTLQDKYLRLAAEFENYKRLAQKEQRDFSRFANESLLKELLPILDNLERAIKASKEASQASGKTDGLIQGVELTHKQFAEALSKFGVQPIVSVGQVFDPARHQAVARVESDRLPENTVAEEYQKGYLLHERVLRPAMVSVATAPAGRQENVATSGSSGY